MSVDRKTYGPEYDRYMAETYLCRHCLHRHSILTGGNCAGEWAAMDGSAFQFKHDIVNNVIVNSDQLARLRELRLWHWKEALRRRNAAKDHEGYARITNDATRACYKAQVRTHNASADQHIKFVQTLNDLFPADDTAERDAAKVVK